LFERKLSIHRLAPLKWNTGMQKQADRNFVLVKNSSMLSTMKGGRPSRFRRRTIRQRRRAHAKLQRFNPRGKEFEGAGGD